MEFLTNLNAAIAYIEANLCETVDMEQLGRIACVDADSFARFFSYMTGMTLNEYIRRRRLTLAAMELQEHSIRTIDLAVKYGYDSADAFARAFKKQHGVTPSQAREVGTLLGIYPPASFYISIRGGRRMNYRMIELEETRIAGISRKFDGTAAERFGQEQVMWALECDFVPEKICNGFDGIWYGIWNDGTYWIARSTEDATMPQLESTVIPAGTYAAFTTECGGFAGDELPKLREQIFDVWLLDSGYVQKGDFEVEVYHLWTDKAERRKKRYYEIWIPVEKK